MSFKHSRESRKIIDMIDKYFANKFRHVAVTKEQFKVLLNALPVSQRDRAISEKEIAYNGGFIKSN